MFYVYMIHSPSTGRFYYGFTSDLEQRLLRHNQRREKATRHGAPWNMVGYLTCDNRSHAMTTESKLKCFKNPQKAIEYIQQHGNLISIP